jgi:sortase A
MNTLATREDWPLGIECAWPPLAERLTQTVAAVCQPKRYRLRLLRLLAALAFGIGLWQIGQGAYIQAKAWLAQALIGQAWARTLNGEQHVKPWPWADTWPVARISVPGRDIERFVLAGANGRAIAFGPGHVTGTPLPGEDGNSVIGAHRDTHFAFLRMLQTGEEIIVEKSDGSQRRYRVSDAEIVDKSDTRVLMQPAHETLLTLITCYPFDALRAGGPLRYVITATAL